jgi:small subunit ribosomal protein S15
MPLDRDVKQQVILDHARAEGDTGSAEVQIAIMHSRITQITGHLKQNKKDQHSLRGLMILVGKRRRLEAYLKKKDINRYRELIKKLGIRETKPR